MTTQNATAASAMENQIFHLRFEADAQKGPDPVASNGPARWA